MNKFIGEIDRYHFFFQIKLIDITYINKDDYAYIFYTFSDNFENTIIAKEKSELIYNYVEYKCKITGNIINGLGSKEWDKIARVDIQDGKIQSITQQYKFSTDELIIFKSTNFTGKQRVNYYNPKTMEIFCYTGENKQRKLQIGDILTCTSTIKKHTTFKGVNQTIMNVLNINEVKW